MNLRGRKKIFTDYEKVDKDNVIQILRDAIPAHEMNRSEMYFLLNYEKGEEPLVREKTARSDIDIHAILNLANYITEFKLGYVWSNPISIVQKSDKLPKNSDSAKDNDAVALLNDYYFSEEKDSKDQELARFVEICGIGYQMIDIKRDYEEGLSPFDLINLSPLYTFIVYSSDIRHDPVLGVTYTVDRLGQKKQYTCVAKDAVYIINSQYEVDERGKVKLDKNGEPIIVYDFAGRNAVEANPIGDIYIGECDRSFDRTGCFERLIDDLDALNVMASDLSNDISQTTQTIWLCNDIEFEKDEVGNPIAPVSGQWVLTKSNANSNQKPDVHPVTVQYDYNGVLQNIESKHDLILERAFVPRQSDPGGGSTGTAMSMSSGWAAAEAAACKESLVLKKFFQWRNRIAIKAVQKAAQVGNTDIDNLSPNDVDIRFIRQKTFDMATKVNSLATMLNCMVDPKTAMATVDLFSNLAEAIDDSIDNMKKYQENQLGKDKEKETDEVDSQPQIELDADGNPIVVESSETNETTETKRMMPDSSDQAQNSPASDL